MNEGVTCDVKWNSGLAKPYIRQENENEKVTYRTCLV